MKRRVRPQPAIVEAPLGVKEYWYDDLYRVLVVPVEEGCYLLSMDVYVEGCCKGEGEERVAVEAAPVALSYHELGVDKLKLLEGVRVEKAEVVVLEYDGGREAITARLLLCGLSGYPDYETVRRLYDAVGEALGFKRVRLNT